MADLQDPIAEVTAINNIDVGSLYGIITVFDSEGTTDDAYFSSRLRQTRPGYIYQNIMIKGMRVSSGDGRADE